MVTAARTLAIFQEICSKPPANSSKIKNIIINFYCNNENRRIMPAAHDKVSIATSVYEQKRLVLCMLKNSTNHLKKDTQELNLEFLHLQN